MEDLISIIVPIYNVEVYLKKCLDSIIHQTYQNLEIILVDDGSPDNCGKICDYYAQKDPRIKVIHQKNGGLSDARNTGLKQATGNLIGFVDSDDYIHENMFQMLFENLKKYQADIAVCGIQCVDKKGTVIQKNNQKEITILEKEEALYSLVASEKIVSVVWDKLYKKALWENVQFPTGKVIEDLATTYQVLEKADRIVIDERIGYYNLLQRKDSIMYNRSDKLLIDFMEATNQRFSDLTNRYSQLTDVLIKDKLACIANLYKLFYEAENQNNQLSAILEKEYHFYRTYYQNHKKQLNCGQSFRIQLEYWLLHQDKKLFRTYCHFLNDIKNLKTFLNNHLVNQKHL